MVRSLQRKFILIAMLSLLGTMAVLCIAIGVWAGVGHFTMHTWISRYRAEGVSALSENGNAQKRTCNEEIRRKAAEEYLSGQGSSMAIAKKYKLRSGNFVLDWAKEYHRRRENPKEAGGVSVARQKHTLEERVQAVREHLEDGKSLSELSAQHGVTVQVVRRAAEEQKYSVTEACRALHISRAGYYRWRSGRAGARTVENRRLAGLVKKIHAENPD